MIYSNLILNITFSPSIFTFCFMKVSIADPDSDFLGLRFGLWFFCVGSGKRSRFLKSLDPERDPVFLKLWIQIGILKSQSTTLPASDLFFLLQISQRSDLDPDFIDKNLNTEFIYSFIKTCLSYNKYIYIKSAVSRLFKVDWLNKYHKIQK